MERAYDLTCANSSSDSDGVCLRIDFEPIELAEVNM